MPPMPHKHYKRLKIYADASVPKIIIDELRAAGIPTVSATEKGHSTLPDKKIYQQAVKQHCVLLTMDRDFWNDRKFPLQKGGRIIFVDIPPGQPNKAIDGLARFYSLFAKYYPLEWWENTKARITETGFAIKYRTYEGKKSEIQFLLTNEGKLLWRKVK